jgi:hypothetical protein
VNDVGSHIFRLQCFDTIILNFLHVLNCKTYETMKLLHSTALYNFKCLLLLTTMRVGNTPTRTERTVLAMRILSGSMFLNFMTGTTGISHKCYELWLLLCSIGYWCYKCVTGECMEAAKSWDCQVIYTQWPYTHTHTHSLLLQIALAYLVYMFSLRVQATELQFAQPKEWTEWIQILL